MIKSAADVEIEPESLKKPNEAIAVHTRLEPDDIQYLYSSDTGDKQILNHYVAVDHKTKSIVLSRCCLPSQHNVPC